MQLYEKPKTQSGGLGVGGSNPLAPTNIINGLRHFLESRCCSVTHRLHTELPCATMLLTSVGRLADWWSMTKDTSSSSRAALTKFVGYKEVTAATGVSRKTVERMVSSGGFPKPQRLTPQRVGWPLHVVEEWLQQLRSSITKSATDNPNDLGPDELFARATATLAQAVSKLEGVPVGIREIRSVTIGKKMTEQELSVCEAQEFELYSKRFSHFSLERSVILAAWLFPALRPMLCDEDGAHPILNDPNSLGELGPVALDDLRWSDLEREWELNISDGRKPYDAPQG